MLPRFNTNWIVTGILFSATLSGCIDHSKIRRPSVSDLYADALAVAKVDNSLESEHHEQTETVAPVLQVEEYIQPQEPESLKTAPPFGQPLDLELPQPNVESASYAVPQEEIPFDGATNNGSVLITEFFAQTDLREAIEIISEQTGDTVIIDDTVGGVVSVQISNATFEDALKTLLLPLGLVSAVHDGAFIVAPPDPSSPLFAYVSVRSYFEPKHHLASKLVELLPDRYHDFFQLSDDRNLIVIDAPKSIGNEMWMRLEELDQPVQQVVLEAIVCVTAPDCEFRFGMDWNHVMKLESADQLNVGLNGLAFKGATSAYGVQNAFDDFAVTSAFVQLLSNEGYVTIRAAPRVTAKDGEKASISIARETFFSLQPSASNVLFRQDVQKVDAGINMIITPKIRGDMITVDIEKAEVSEDIRSSNPRPELSTNPYPIINRRQVSTKVDVRDGHTIVIGGLVQRQTVDRVRRIPGLSKIPGLGRLFRTIEKQEQDAEVAIFISPRIVPISQSH